MKLHFFRKRIINTWNASWIILISTSSRVGYPNLGISGIPKRPQRSNASVLSFKALSNNSLIWNETLKLLHLIIFWPPFFLHLYLVMSWCIAQWLKFRLPYMQYLQGSCNFSFFSFFILDRIFKKILIFFKHLAYWKCEIQ